MHFIVYVITSLAPKVWLHKFPILQIILPMFRHIVKPFWLCIKLRIHKKFVGTDYVFHDDDDDDDDVWL